MLKLYHINKKNSSVTVSIISYKINNHFNKLCHCEDHEELNTKTCESVLLDTFNV